MVACKVVVCCSFVDGQCDPAIAPWLFGACCCSLCSTGASCPMLIRSPSVRHTCLLPCCCLEASSGSTYLFCALCVLLLAESAADERRKKQQKTTKKKPNKKKKKQSRANRILLAVSVEGQRAGVARRSCADGAHSEIGHRSQRKSLPVICVRLSRS